MQGALGPDHPVEQEITGQRWTDYVERFEGLERDGADLAGEARFLDMMAPRAATILDGGCGTGRVAAQLTARGHTAVGLDRDAGLVEIARRKHPDTRYAVLDLLEVSPEQPASRGLPTRYDIVALPGNVLLYCAEGTQARILTTLARVVVPGGRLVCGFAADRGIALARIADEVDPARAVLEHHFATWHLDPAVPGSTWSVGVFRVPGALTPQ